jgi:hypothetical protein
MMNFEKIDDYLANRLTAEDKQAFEHDLSGDPALKDEVAFQQQIIKTVQQARVNQLKHMLNQVPITSSGWSTGQIAAAVVSVGVVATSLYFYFQNDEPTISPELTQPEFVIQPEVPTEAPIVEPKEEETVPNSIAPKKEPITRKEQTVTPVQKPDIQVVDPSDEFKEAEEPADKAAPGRSELSVSKMEVVTSAASKKYTFHYEFSEGKLHLYGPFDKSLYEILEINGDGHAVFLFYKENYYLLDESQHTVAPLTPIREGTLLKKLREYQGR